MISLITKIQKQRQAEAPNFPFYTPPKLMLCFFAGGWTNNLYDICTPAIGECRNAHQNPSNHGFVYSGHKWRFSKWNDLDRQGPTQEEIDQVPYRMLWGALGTEFQWLIGVKNQKVGPTVDGRKKSCTSWYGRYPIIYKVLYIPSGAGFLPSTVFILKTYSTVVVAWIRFTKLLFLAVQKLTTIGQWSPKTINWNTKGIFLLCSCFSQWSCW